jgi:hypothetical protein
MAAVPLKTIGSPSPSAIRKRSTSRILRMGNLCPGMPRSLLKGARHCRFAGHPTAFVTPVHSQPGRDPPEWVVAINRNRWSQSAGAPRQNSKGGNPIVSAAILGSIFNYVDFLTNPPWQPMLIAFVALCGGRSLFDAAKFVLAWLAGYALTWVSKWVIG